MGRRLTSTAALLRATILSDRRSPMPGDCTMSIGTWWGGVWTARRMPGCGGASGPPPEATITSRSAPLGLDCDSSGRSKWTEIRGTESGLLREELREAGIGRQAHHRVERPGPEMPHQRTSQRLEERFPEVGQTHKRALRHSHPDPESLRALNGDWLTAGQERTLLRLGATAPGVRGFEDARRLSRQPVLDT